MGKNEKRSELEIVVTMGLSFCFHISFLLSFLCGSVGVAASSFFAVSLSGPIFLEREALKEF
jgi:hypothetical protein